MKQCVNQLRHDGTRDSRATIHIVVDLEGPSTGEYGGLSYCSAHCLLDDLGDPNSGTAENLDGAVDRTLAGGGFTRG